MRRFVRELALIPAVCRCAWKHARFQALDDHYRAKVEREHHSLPPYERRRLASHLRDVHLLAKTLDVVRLRHHHLSAYEQYEIARRLDGAYDDPVEQARRGVTA